MLLSNFFVSIHVEVQRSSIYIVCIPLAINSASGFCYYYSLFWFVSANHLHCFLICCQRSCLKIMKWVTSIHCETYLIHWPSCFVNCLGYNLHYQIDAINLMVHLDSIQIYSHCHSRLFIGLWQRCLSRVSSIFVCITRTVLHSFVIISIFF